MILRDRLQAGRIIEKRRRPASQKRTFKLVQDATVPVEPYVGVLYREASATKDSQSRMTSAPNIPEDTADSFILPSWSNRQMPHRFIVKSKKGGNENLPIMIRIQSSRNDQPSDEDSSSSSSLELPSPLAFTNQEDNGFNKKFAICSPLGFFNNWNNPVMNQPSGSDTE
jgi:hypothetical protein